MLRLAGLLALAIGLDLGGLVSTAQAVELWQLQESRYCGAPERYADGTIKRSRAVLMAFARLHPCPSNGLPDINCPGWALDHTISLACGGCDSVSNLQWLPDEIKSCAEPWCKDRWERKVYAAKVPHPDTEACRNKVLMWITPETQP